MPAKPTKGTSQLATEINADHKAAFLERVAAEQTSQRKLIEEMIAHFLATVPTRAPIELPKKKKT